MRRFLNIYQNCPYFAPKGPDPLFERIQIPIPKHVSNQVWLKLAYWFLRIFVSISLYITDVNKD